MAESVYSDLQIREIFHLEFLRSFGRKIKPDLYALKGGVNLRLFFNSIRYSEDMDLDVRGAGVYFFKDCVMNILRSLGFQENLKSFGIKQVISPAIERAKQTETTQRFKVHLITSADVDLFTKIELSHRGMAGEAVVQAPSERILRAYKIAPVLIPHYDINSAVTHKIKALAGRTIIQARDIFDLYILSAQLNPDAAKKTIPEEGSIFSKAYDNIFEIKFEVFRDTVVSYLAVEDQAAYNNPSAWEEIRLKTAAFIEQLRKKYA
jgi:predicted nucleotidyltransferase component of viral defense system